MPGGTNVIENRNLVRALVVDDEEFSRRTLSAMIAQETGIEIVGESVSALDARQRVAELQPELVFLDIGMEAGRGIDMWRSLAEPRPYLIAMTAYPELALRAFEIEADDYFMKPLQRQRFAAGVTRARKRIAERRIAGFALQIAGAAAWSGRDRAIGAFAPSNPYPDQMTIRVRRRLFSLDVSDITWIQGASQYSRVHARTGEFLLSRTLASLECELDPARFFRIHRSAIVNAAYIKEVRSRGDGCYNVYLQGGQGLPMGRARREILEKLLSSVGRQQGPACEFMAAGALSSASSAV